MNEESRDTLKDYVKRIVGEKGILEQEFKSLGLFFKTLGLKQNIIYMQQYNDHLIDSIVTSLVVHYHQKEIDINSVTDEEIKEEILKSIKVAKETFAYMIKKFT